MLITNLLIPEWAIIGFMGLPSWYWIGSLFIATVIIIYILGSIIHKRGSRRRTKGSTSKTGPRCSDCHTAIDEMKKSCPNCKKKFIGDRYICPDCRSVISADVDSCPECGSEFLPISAGNRRRNIHSNDADIDKLDRSFDRMNMIECPTCTALYEKGPYGCPYCSGSSRSIL